MAPVCKTVQDRAHTNRWVTFALETRGCTSIYETMSAVTVNRFDNGKSNDRLHRKNFDVQLVPYGEINTNLNASKPLNDL